VRSAAAARRGSRRRHPACPATRRILKAKLRYWGLGHLYDAVALCVTELISNVHKHAPAPGLCTMVVQRMRDGVCITVSDRSEDLPRTNPADGPSESGMGLFLVDATASSWAARPTATGKDVTAIIRTLMIDASGIDDGR
jgi:anti-sigma regulatory factor (Ser/Thr protein kinase)